MLRHTIATLAYRAGKTLRGAPAGFEHFTATPGTRTPARILAHMGDLLDWAAGLADGRNEYHESEPQPWDLEVERFFQALAILDRRLALPAPLGFPAERIFSGPIADALTHTGQIGMLRRMAGSPVRGENYFRANIAEGRVARIKPPPCASSISVNVGRPIVAAAGFLAGVRGAE